MIIWVDSSECKSSSITHKYLVGHREIKGLESLTGADMALTSSNVPPLTADLISIVHQDAYFIQIKHGGDILGSEQRMIELERMVNIIPQQSQRYLLQVGRPDSSYGQDYWREKAIHRNWNRLGVTDHIEKPEMLMPWLKMLAKNKHTSIVYRPIPKPRHGIEIIDDYRRTLLSIPGVGLKTVLNLKANNFNDAILELLTKPGKRAENIKRYLNNVSTS